MKELDLGKDKIGKLLMTFSIPCIISMLINSIYNLVDQIFIGQGVGTIGNAATNVIFPLVIIANAIAQLLGNGSAANLSLRLGEGNKEEAKKNIGSGIVLLVILSIVFFILGQIFLPVLIKFFGSTESVYSSALVYGRIILVGAPFMIIYTGLAAIIRADGSPKYSMVCLLIGAFINLILDPIFIFGFNLGVAGGAWATVIGQVVSFMIAVVYIPKIKSIDLDKSHFKLNKSVFKTMGLGLSSFITQMTILALFVAMNNVMTKYGASSKFGADIPLSVYGIISKINSLYVSCILGIAIGAQPIIGYNYGRGNYKRVKQTIERVIAIALIIGIIFNLSIVLFPEQIIKVFITSSDSNYDLFMEFAIDFCHIFLMICAVNAIEISTSISIQSLGKVKKSTAISFTRQIILFIPIALVLCHFNGLYGALYAGPIADSICFVFVSTLLLFELKHLSKLERETKNIEKQPTQEIINSNNNIVVTIAREYGSGGRYVGNLLADKLGFKFYDKELIKEISQQSGLSEQYISENEEKHEVLGSYEYNLEDKLFIEESNAIKNIASKESCVIIGRASNYVLRNYKNIYNIFLYSDLDSKINRVSKYYNIKSKDIEKYINNKDEERGKYYHYYTNNDWKDFNNYDFAINVDKEGVEKTVEILYEIIKNR